MAKIDMALYQKVIVCFFLTIIFVSMRKKCNAYYAIDLTEANFNKTITEHDFVLIMYYTSGCAPCEKFLPDFEYAGGIAKTKKPSVLFAKINCAKSLSKQLCLEITAFPVLKFFKFGRYADDFIYRDRENMAMFATKFVSPKPEKILSKQHYLNYLDSTTYAVIGIFPFKYSKLKEAYFNVTNLMYERFDYAYTFSKEIMIYQNVKQGIIVFKPHYMRNELEEDFSVYNSEPDLDKIKNFILKSYHGLVGFRRPENKHEFSLPLLTVFYRFDFKNNQAKSTEIRRIVLRVARKYRGLLNFVMSSSLDWPGLLKKFGYEHVDDEKPIVTAMDIHERKYVMQDKFSAEAVEEFVRKFIGRSLMPFVRSAPVPSNSEGLIYEVVARNLEEVVMNNNNDTLLYIYNPDCSICQEMSVQYQILAEELMGESIFISKINGIVNDIPKLVKPIGYPTLFFLQKNRKHKPISFYGGPYLHDLIVFVSLYSTHELKKFDRQGKRRMEKAEL